MNRKILCLRNINIYDGIDEVELIRITKDAIEGDFKQGTVFYSPEVPARDVFVLKEGEIELFRDVSGKKVIIETLFPGDVFGDFGIGDSNHTAVVTKKAYICKTPTNEFLDVIKAHPEIALKLMKALAEKTAYYEDKIANLSLPAKEQLFQEIKRLDEKNKRKVFGKFFNIPLRISHQRLAEKTGLNRVTVTKLMGKLKEEGRILVDKKTGIIQVIEV